MVRSKQGVAIVPDFIKEIYDPEFVRIPMKTSPSYEYELMSLTDNDNPVIDIIMDLAKEM